MCREIPTEHIFKIDVQEIGSSYIFMIAVWVNILRMQMFLRDVLKNIDGTHLQDRCAGKDPDYTSLREVCRETPRVHIFQIDVQVNSQSTHL